ncbi:MAG: cupin domain-containing protein, partial [Propionibacteriaceae bacterium]|nr:cupin domain-containing protein [Propionibacteriaceae bacterium]
MPTPKSRLAAIAIAASLASAPLAMIPASHAAPDRAPISSTGHGYGTTVKDLGAAPATFMIAQETLKNRNFRTAAWTAKDLQLTLMSIPVGGDVGLEIHHGVDQFFRVESGTARVMMGTEESFTYVKDVGPGAVILIPDGTWHNIVNTGKKSLQLYSMYGPAQHPLGTVHRTQADDPHADEATPNPTVSPVSATDAWSADPGQVPFVFNIEDVTEANTNFRTAAWTGETLQVTLMNIPVGGDVGLEMHSDVDQFLRVESGKAKVYFGDSEGNLKFAGVAQADRAILVPAGTWHNIVNDSPKQPLKLYSIYGPAQHPQGTVHA